MTVTILEDVLVDRAMAIFAHPDDAEFGNAGLAATWADQGVEWTYVLATNGASGSSDPDMSRERLTELRYAEQRAACDVLGVKHLVTLGFEDGELYPTLELREAVAREIRRAKPDVIVTSDPTVRFAMEAYVNHPDHIAIGEVVCRSINPDASSGLMFQHLRRDEGLEPHLPKVLLLQAFEGGDFVVDIAGALDRKLEALGCHESQHDDRQGVQDMVVGWCAKLGESIGSPAAEAFRAFRVG
ncbi:MAG: PIG-L deacetylase family protein [Actinomycetota bacterium]